MLINFIYRIANFWRKRLQDASIVEREYPYGQTFHPEQQQQAEALKAWTKYRSFDNFSIDEEGTKPDDELRSRDKEQY